MLFVIYLVNGAYKDYKVYTRDNLAQNSSLAKMKEKSVKFGSYTIEMSDITKETAPLVTKNEEKTKEKDKESYCSCESEDEDSEKNLTMVSVITTHSENETNQGEKMKETSINVCNESEFTTASNTSSSLYESLHLSNDQEQDNDSEVVATIVRAHFEDREEQEMKDSKDLVKVEDDTDADMKVGQKDGSTLITTEKKMTNCGDNITYVSETITKIESNNENNHGNEVQPIKVTQFQEAVCQKNESDNDILETEENSIIEELITKIEDVGSKSDLSNNDSAINIQSSSDLESTEGMTFIKSYESFKASSKTTVKTTTIRSSSSGSETKESIMEQREYKNYGGIDNNQTSCSLTYDLESDFN